jgi:hypothetical protein
MQAHLFLCILPYFARAYMTLGTTKEALLSVQPAHDLLCLEFFIFLTEQTTVHQLAAA